jgi:hypothetical protein
MIILCLCELTLALIHLCPSLDFLPLVQFHDGRDLAFIVVSQGSYYFNTYCL